MSYAVILKGTDSLPESNIIAVKAFTGGQIIKQYLCDCGLHMEHGSPQSFYGNFLCIGIEISFPFVFPIKPLNLAFDLLLSLSDGILIRPVG